MPAVLVHTGHPPWGYRWRCEGTGMARGAPLSAHFCEPTRWGRAAGWGTAAFPRGQAAICLVDGDAGATRRPEHTNPSPETASAALQAQRRGAGGLLCQFEGTGAARAEGGAARPTWVGPLTAPRPASFHSVHQAAAMARPGGARARLLVAAALLCLCCWAAGAAPRAGACSR